MKIIKYGLFGLLGLVVLFVVVGLVLPSEYKVERSIRIQAPPERIFTEINDLKNWPKWTMWSERDPNMKIEYEGAETGVTAKNKWDSESQGSGEMTITESVPGELIRYDLVFADFDMSSVGTMRLEKEDGGTRVTWSDEGTFGANPIYKYFGLFLDGMIGPDFEGGLKNLKVLCEQAE